MRRAHLEWLWRLALQPARVRRMAVLPFYALAVLRGENRGPGPPGRQGLSASSHLFGLGLARVDLSVVVPCFNEQSRLPSSLSAALTYLDASGREYELILVDDGSRDCTPELIREAERAHPAVCGVLLPENRGKGHAVAAGVRISRGALVLVSDAD